MLSFCFGEGLGRVKSWRMNTNRSAKGWGRGRNSKNKRPESVDQQWCETRPEPSLDPMRHLSSNLSTSVFQNIFE